MFSWAACLHHGILPGCYLRAMHAAANSLVQKSSSRDTTPFTSARARFQAFLLQLAFTFP